MSLSYIRAYWPAPQQFHAITTTRNGGVSQMPFASLNLGDHVGDKQHDVDSNRQRLQETLNLPAAPTWLKQTHSTTAVLADAHQQQSVPEADASFSDNVGIVCCVMTADCVPIVLCSPSTGEIAAIHAGWRGLCDGVIEATVKAMNTSAQDMIAWIGPCISQAAFEVGDEVRAQFIATDKAAQRAFLPNAQGRWHADLVKISAQRLRYSGINGIYGGHFCTYREPERFFSYRRDNQTGRMATMIWRSQ